MSEQDRPKGDMTVAEAGRKGGAALRAQIGREGYVALGKLGGAVTRSRHGTDHYREIGRKGGEANLARRGREWMREIGKRGGNRVRELTDAGRRAEAEEQER
jgi:uncharacterized protein